MQRRLNFSFFSFLAWSWQWLSGTLSLMLQLLNNYCKINTVKIKWPNDVYAGNKKICGILSEMIAETAMIKYIIIGIGININSIPELDSAVSVRQITGQDTDRNKLLSQFIGLFFLNYRYYENRQFEKIFLEWKNNLAWIGKEISINTGNEILRGVFKDVYPDGSITLTQNGVDKRYYSGDLILPGV